MVHHHHIAVHADFVRVQIGGDGKLGDHPGVCGIGNIDNRGAMGRAHMPDIGVVALDDHLPGARQFQARL